MTYQWLRNGAPIAGADDPTYVLTAGDRGKRIQVRVTGVLARDGTEVETSAKTAAVAT